MKQVRIADTTLCKENSHFSFKEKLEIARLLERLSVDTIELPEVIDEKTDILFVVLFQIEVYSSNDLLNFSIS